MIKTELAEFTMKRDFTKSRLGFGRKHV